MFIKHLSNVRYLLLKSIEQKSKSQITDFREETWSSTAAALAKRADDEMAIELMTETSLGVSDVKVTLDNAVEDVMGVSVVLGGKNRVDE
jgi:hypothetical protein